MQRPLGLYDLEDGDGGIVRGKNLQFSLSTAVNPKYSMSEMQSQYAHYLSSCKDLTLNSLPQLLVEFMSIPK